MTETKRDELLKKIELFAETFGCAVAELRASRRGVDDLYALMVVDEIRDNIGRLEGYLDDFEKLVESDHLEY